MCERFISLDALKPEQKIWLYGTGSGGRAVFAYLQVCRPDIDVLGFLDSHKSGELYGKKVIRFDSEAPPDLGESDVLIASHAHGEIAESLHKAGIQHSHPVSTPSYLLANIFYDGGKVAATYKKKNPTAGKPPGREHLFFGEYGGAFVGNNKYFYLYLLENGCKDIYWVCERKEIYSLLADNGLPVIYKSDERFWERIHRGGFFYFDNMTWQRKYPFLANYPAIKIHMSHGVGLKLTERMMVPQSFFEKLSSSQYRRFDDAIMKNDLLVSTSPFYAEKVSSPAYSTPLERITIDGYPKNDLFYHDVLHSGVGVDIETLRWIREQKKNGCKIILYAPTFRDFNAAHSESTGLDLELIHACLRRNNWAMVIKGHANSAGEASGQSRWIRFHQKQGDVYPALKEADFFVTDYSSIYMDVLHLDIPIVFFPYDWNEYKDIHRQLQFEYASMTPGPKAYTTAELINQFEKILARGEDAYQGQRRRIFEMAFKHQDGLASKRLAGRIRAMEAAEIWTR